jgi:CheY-like chemotaxis protein
MSAGFGARCVTVVTSDLMNTEAPTAAADILLLSQHPEEASLVRSAASEDRIHVVDTCGLVLPFLRRERDEFRDAPRPDLVLLDLDIEDQEECDTLVQIKTDPHLRGIPVVVISHRAGRQAAFSAYDLHANAYVVKPPDPEVFVQVVRGILYFWLKLARLPGSGETI